MDFFRFPRTPHLAWLGASPPRGDKVLAPDEADALLAHELLVEEKVDGANVGLSVDGAGVLRAQNRGAFLFRDHCHAQFKPLFRFMAARERALAEALHPGLVLFGEWCYAKHSIHYTRLPDWFLAFDVYDAARGEFWSAERRDALAHDLDVAVVPRLARGRFDLAGLRALIGESKLTEGPAEGVYVRRDEGGTLAARAKLVRAEFAQAIEEHWSRKALEVNRLAR